MGLFRWIAEKGFRVTMLIAILTFVYHVVNELRVLAGGARNFHQRLELTALDVKFAARGKNPPPNGWKVGIAAVDEKGLGEFGPFPWSRTVYATMVDKLTANGAKSIAFDMTFDQPSPTAAQDTAKMIAERAKTTGLFDVADDAVKIAESAEKIAAALEAKPKKAGVKELAAPLRNTAKSAKQASQKIRAFESELEKAGMRIDPDDVFAKAMKDSGKVVLGVINLSKLEAESLGKEELARSLRAVSTSTIGELISKSDSGVGQIYSDVKQTFDTGFYLRFFGTQAPFDKLAHSTKHFATINALPDDDGVFRRVPLVSTVKGSGFLLPTLGLKAAEVAMDPETISVIGTPSDESPQGIQIGDTHISTELGGATTLDWYGHFNAEEMPIFSISDIVNDRIPKKEIEGRIFFVAATAVGTYDQRVTPLERAIPGVYVHATLAQNILDGRHITRPQHIIAIELALFLFVGLVAGLLMTRMAVIGQIIVAFAMTAGWLLLDQLVLFKSGIVVYNVLPVFQIFITFLAVALWRFFVEQRAREATKTAFGRYLAPAVMEQVLTKPEEYLKLGGRRYEATVLFSDIRGFTTISEALSPEELGMLLNRYMTPMTDIVFKHGGTLDKYIGDAVMAFWGAPLEQQDHAVRACRAALEMIAKVEDLNREFEAAGLPRIAIGIGLSSGPMTIGNMGSDDHFSYTALGDRVNLGARLEGQTKDYGVDIIISDACYQYVKDVMCCRELGALRVKGKYEPVRIYQLIGEQKDSQARMSFVNTFHEGLECYRAQKWDEAVEHFTRARALSGITGDKCSDQYIMWCLEYKEEPPPPNWDGVRVATSK